MLKLVLIVNHYEGRNASLKLSEGVESKLAIWFPICAKQWLKSPKCVVLSVVISETVAIAKTTPAMTLKRLVRPEQSGRFNGTIESFIEF